MAVADTARASGDNAVHGPGPEALGVPTCPECRLAAGAIRATVGDRRDIAAVVAAGGSTNAGVVDDLAGCADAAEELNARLVAADHLFELDADLLRIATELEGHPDNVAASLLGGFVVCADGEAVRLEAPDGLEAILVVPEEAVRTKIAREALPAEVPLFDAVANVAHGALLMLGLARGDFDLVARGLHDRLHQDRRAHLFPKSIEVVRRARETGALGATISGAGPTVLVWSRYEQTGAVVDRLRQLTDGWARVMRTPFESAGADVRSL